MTNRPDLEAILPDLEANQPPSILLHLLNQSGARKVLSQRYDDLGLADILPYPFSALVGQTGMRLALLLGLINPAIGGVLLIGPRGVGKTTAVRSLINLLPEILVSTCPEGCLPEDYEISGEAGVCSSCAAKLARGESITRFDQVKLIELPLNARLDDVVGGVNERIALQQNRIQLERGILSRADQNLLYIDEVNLLEHTVTDAILDAVATGSYTVRRGAMVGTYRSRFVLIGSMNPEEGNLRPQIMDRFGLRVTVRGLMTTAERYEIYNRVRAYRTSPRGFLRDWASETEAMRVEVQAARDRLPDVTLDDQAIARGLDLVQSLAIDSHRAEYALFEAARAHAAADSRPIAEWGDIKAVAPFALRLRGSPYMIDFLTTIQAEDQIIASQIESLDTMTNADSNA